ncbi:hypothetical protein [uncultured Kordia sp.]|uniref:hypothetical protein n=1 Tax=uncultured Kordia sp. TaxID=507699 RepID=UPI002604F5E7|nr:hypothetical protein [uncultured Kordia sp.]
MKLTDRKVVLYLFLLLVSTQTFGQNIRPEIKKITEAISKGKQLEGPRIGFGGMSSSQYSRFEKLKKTTTEKELLTLLQHENPIVKGYAAWALADKKYHKLVSVFNTFLNTKEFVQTQRGCIISEDLLAWTLYSHIVYPSHEIAVTEADKKYYKEQIQKFDKIILRKREQTFLLRIALENNQANPENYAIIKSLALEDGNVGALAELAKYQKESDIDIILEKGTVAFKAMSHFPNPRFWNFLMKHKTTANSLDYFKAIAAFQNEEATQTLRSIYKTFIKEERKGITSLAEAIIELYCPKYKKLTLEIFADTKLINFNHAKKLLKIAPKESLPYFIDGLLTDNGNNFLDDYLSFSSKDSVLPLLLKNIKKYQPERMPEICVYNVSKAEFIHLVVFLEFIIEDKIEAAKQPLMTRLEKKTYPFETFHLTRTLLSFKDKSLHKEIERILSASQKNWDDGIWSASFKELFEKYGINI